MPKCKAILSLRTLVFTPLRTRRTGEGSIFCVWKSCIWSCVTRSFQFPPPPTTVNHGLPAPSQTRTRIPSLRSHRISSIPLPHLAKSPTHTSVTDDQSRSTTRVPRLPAMIPLGHRARKTVSLGFPKKPFMIISINSLSPVRSVAFVTEDISRMTS